MKTCFKCNTRKEYIEFYKHSAMGDGYLGKCKECTKKDVHKHREDNLEKVKAYDRNRPNHAERIKRNRLVAKTGKYKKVNIIRQKQYRKKYPIKTKARAIFSYARKKGYIQKEPCYICGKIESQAHHEDYNYPIDVIWLCDFHHKERHKETNEERRRAINFNIL